MDFEHEFSTLTSSSSSQETSPPSHTSTTISPKRKAGRKKFKETRHPIYRGVRQRKGAKWVCEVRVPNTKTRIWLGTYPTPEMAARANDVAALALRGKSAPLNFQDSAWLLPRAKSTSAIDIRAAAAEAAETFQPTATTSSSSSSSSSSSTTVSSTTVDQKLPESDLKSITETSSSMIFWDEEAMFNMPAFLDSMAEGLLLSPPARQNGCNWDDDDLGSNMNFSLW